MSNLNEDTQWLVEHLFAPEKQTEVERLLETECSATIYHGQVSADDVDRVNFAALKFSKGDIVLFRQAIQTGQFDFRDLLGMGGFAGSLKAHRKWYEQLRQKAEPPAA